MAGSERKKIDWERIEPGWRQGVKSVMQLAADYEAETGNKVSHTAINKHFKRLGVPRDLNARVQAKAESLVSAATVSARVSTETTLTDAQLVNEIAKDVAAIQLSQRNDIAKARTLSAKLLDELQGQTDSQELLEALGDMMRSPDENGIDKLNDLYRKVISTPSRIDSMRKLADTIKTLVTLERDAWGMKTEQPVDHQAFVTEIISLVDGTSKGLPGESS